MRIDETAILNRINQPLFPPYTPPDAGGWVEVELNTQTGPVTVKVDGLIAEAIAGRKVSWNNLNRPPHRRHLRVTMGQKWKRSHGMKPSRASNVNLHRLVFAEIFGLVPSVPVDHWANVTDNRIRSLRLVNGVINGANGSGTNTVMPGVRWHSQSKLWNVLVRLDHQRSFGYYPTQSAGWQATQPVLYYRARKHAGISAAITGRYLADCVRFGNAFAGLYASDFPVGEPGQIAYAAALANPGLPPVSIVTPPLNFLRDLVRMAANGNSVLAVQMARQLGAEDAVLSVKRWAMGVPADAPRDNSGGGAS